MSKRGIHLIKPCITVRAVYSRIKSSRKRHGCSEMQETEVRYIGCARHRDISHIARKISIGSNEPGNALENPHLGFFHVICAADRAHARALVDPRAKAALCMYRP